MKFDQIIKIIENNDSFILAGHVNPDGDCVGACTALALALKQMGKVVTIYLEQYPIQYSFLSGKRYVQNNVYTKDNFDVFIALDCGDIGRLGEAKYYIDNIDESINIDHHGSNTNFAKCNKVFEDLSSTSEIIYHLLTQLNLKIEKDIAEALFVGIVYDTGVFRHSNTSSSTHEVVSKLLKTGINSSEIINHLFYSIYFEEAKLLGYALGNLKRYYNNKASISYITLDELNANNIDVNDFGGVIQYISQIKGSEVSIFLYEKKKGEIKVSFRSKKYLDVSKLAKTFNGGGHKRASGCTINGDLNIIKEKIIKELENYIK